VAKNLTNVELDWVDDLNGSMKLASQNENIVGKCKVGDVENLKDEDYALLFMTKHGSDGRYPLKTRDQALLSCWFLEKNASKLPAEHTKVAATNLKKSCEKHQIPISDFIQKNASDEVVSNAISPYIGENEKFACQGKYPINTPDQVKIAVAYFESNHKHFTPDDAFEYCNNVASAAEEHGVKIASEKKINDYIPKYSNMLKLAVDRRLNLLDGLYEYGDKNGEAIKLSYRKLLGMKESLEPVEFSKKLAHIDKLSGIDTHWDKGSISNPYVATFKRVEKNIVKVGSATYNRSQLVKVADTDKFAGLFSNDFISSFKESPEEVFNSLPMPEKKLIASIIEG